MRGTRAWPPTGLIPWFSKTEGNTYATLLHHPFLFKGKPTQCSRGSKKDFWRRCRGGLRKVKSGFGIPTTSHFWHRCRRVYAQVKTYQVPITNSYPSHYIICHLPLVFLSPTSPLPFYSPSLSQSPPLFSLAFFRCPCVYSFALLLWLVPCPLLCLPSLKSFTSSKGNEKI